MDIEERPELSGMNDLPRRPMEASPAPAPGVIENPVINSPYEEPRHSVFDREPDGDMLCVGMHQ